MSVHSAVLRLLAALAVAAGFCQKLGAQPAAGPSVIHVVSAEPAPDFNALFEGKTGWVGGDAAYSVAVGPNVIWFFGDTLWGKSETGRREAVMVNNSLAVQKRTPAAAPLRFIVGSTDRKPAAFFVPAEGKGWLWPQGAVIAAGRLYLFLSQIERTADGGAFGFKNVRMWLAVIENPQEPPATWRMKQLHVPFAKFSPDLERSWGSALLLQGNDIYIFGYEEHLNERNSKKKLTMARAPLSRLDDFTNWRFRTAAGWSQDPADAVTLVDGVATEFSVGPIGDGKGVALVYTENGLGEKILARFAATLESRWSDPVLLYKCPEPERDKKVFTYSAKVHPWAGSDDELLISYCVNAWEFQQLFKDDRAYRPKFIRVKLSSK